MASDHDSISTEDHELNYILKKFEKRQTESNREILTEMIQTWKADKEWAPYTHDSFYEFLDEEELLDDLEDLE